MKENIKKNDTQSIDDNNANNAVTAGNEGNATSAMFNPNLVIDEALVENNSLVNDDSNANNDVNNAIDGENVSSKYAQLNQDN
eukprot:CAMPEP_0114669942 /NCGR_PEP_ID=MMETSP0191-20121206/38809_1 /TAXON_ID=126664 /ORGANISM="Sorites sp." /LENGTH=82 /DNA_ID=CAMNT_0001926583 /DNA_START=1546 /DNA_END=1794 /DNA_ORIENTATION=+